MAAAGLYLAAAVLVLVIAGLINRHLGGNFHLLKPQVDMLLYFHGMEKNPWTPTSWSWLASATWLVVPASALLWGLHRSFLAPVPDASTRQLVRALTGGLAVSLAMAVNLELRGVGVLAYSFYASFQLCLALPLLAVCGLSCQRTEGNPLSLASRQHGRTGRAHHPGAAHGSGTILSPRPALSPGPGNCPVIAAGCLGVAAGLVALLAPLRFRRPEWLVFGIVGCSIPIGFHTSTMADRLPERYQSVHAAFQTVVREFPRGSCRFWLHPDQPDGLSLASTMLYSYRLFTLQPFPGFETPHSFVYAIIIPCLPGEGPAALATATQVLGQAGVDVVGERVFPIRTDRGIGMNLACFSLREHTLSPVELLAAARQGPVLTDLQFSADPPYTQSIIHEIYAPGKNEVITTTTGYPVFTPTDPRDHLWTRFKPLAPPRPGKTPKVTLVAEMPADGHCFCVTQMDGFQEVTRIALTKRGKSVHLIDVPPEATALRIYLMTEIAAPTALPVSLTIYAPP